MPAILNFVFGKPLLAVFEPTKRCNSKCIMCQIPRTGRKELSLEQIDLIFSKLEKLGIKECFVQGGEPLLRKDFKEILNIISSHKIQPRLVTNGLLLNKEILEFLNSNNYSLTISLDTLKPELYFKLRGVKGLEKVLDNIKLAGTFNNSRWTVHLTASELNYNELFEVKDFAEKNNLWFSALPIIYGIGDAGKRVSNSKNEKQHLIEIFEKLAKESFNSRFFAFLTYKEVIAFLKGNYTKPCDALRYSIHVNDTGILSSCIERQGFMDLLKEPLKNIYNKERLKKVKECVLDTPCFYGCTRGISVFRGNLALMFLHPVKTIKSLLTEGKAFI
ncbi:MAG: radical SAM protein [archaeon]